MGLHGWAGADDGGAFSQAVWTGTQGNPSGVLLLDGSDFGSPGMYPNSLFFQWVILPCNVTTLSFDTLAQNDGLLSVVLRALDGSYETLLDWQQLATTNAWVNLTASLTNHTGQMVTLYFLQEDGGQCLNEARYVDNVKTKVGLAVATACAHGLKHKQRIACDLL